MDHSDAPLPEEIDTATDEAETIHAPFIAAYLDALPRWPIMSAGLEDDRPWTLIPAKSRL